MQTAAAQLLEDWGKSGQTDSPERLLEAIQGRKFEGQADPTKKGIKGWVGLANQYDMVLRPVRGRLRGLREAEETIIAYENTLKEHAQRTAQVESAKTLGEDAKDAEAELAKITDALAATRQWLELKAERDKLQAQPSAGQDADKTRLDRIEQINRFLNHMVDSQYYDKLSSGALKEEYTAEIAKLQKKSDEDSQRKIAHLEELLKESEQELTLLAPAFRTGQRIVRIREQLALLLQREYDQLAQTATVNPGCRRF